MRLEQYLTEGRSNPILMDDIFKVVSQYKDSILAYKNNNHYMMRGLQSSSKYTNKYGDDGFRGSHLFIQPSKFKRRSAYASGNHFTLLIDNLPKWKKYPKRSRSIVCSTDKYKAKEYTEGGSIYYVFPKNGSLIGVCPQDDIFQSFKDLYSLGRFTGACNDEDISDNSWSAMVKSMKEWDDNVKDDDDFLSSSYFDDVMDNFSDRYEVAKGLKKLFTGIFDPDYNGFKLSKTMPSASGYETWTDGDCLMIQEKHIEEFIEAVKDKL